MATEKIYIQIDDNKIELTGVDKETFLEQRAKDQAEQALLEAEYKAKRDARESAITKLGEIAGLTKEELDAIL
jgi:DNA polymerase III sliding clamp (beta) subunit (PCNA family)